MPLADFTFISIAASGSNMLVVHPSIPVNSVAGFVAYAKREPIAYAHGGNGSPGHLCMEYFRLVAGFQTTPVPYRGNPQLVTDLVAGQIKFGFVGTGGVAQHVRAGRLKGLAVSSRKRSPFAPDLPTIAESGYSNFEFDSYYVLATPAGLPEAVAEAFSSVRCSRRWRRRSCRSKFRAQDILIAPTPSAGAKARIRSDFEKWAKVVQATGMQVD